MKLKTRMKFLYASVIILLNVTAANAQLYMRVGSGYAAALAGQSLGNGYYSGSVTQYSYPNISNGNISVTYGAPKYKIHPASFAAGVNGYIGLGYNFNRHVGLQLDGCIGITNKEYAFTEDNGTSGFTISRRADHTIFLIPSLVVQTGNDKATLYARIGLVVPLRTAIMEHETTSSTTDYADLRLTNYLSLGTAGALGIQHKCGGNINIWAEAGFQSLVMFSKKEEVTSGVIYNSTTLRPASVINYSKSNEDGTSSAAFNVPFSTMNFNAGISFRLSHDRKTANVTGNK